MLNALDLFSGIGGLAVALSEWVRSIAYCEIDPYCQGVLLSRMAAKDIQRSPIWNDVRTLKGNAIVHPIDIICAGFPCQDISIAGHGKGLEGERSGLFFEIVRLAKEINPKFIFLENVRAITSRGGLQVVEEFMSLGYDCRWCIISSASIGAPHLRERWFMLAYSYSKSSEQTDQTSQPIEIKKTTWLRSSRQNRGDTPRTYWQTNQSPVLGVDDGVSFRVDRAKAIGNSICVEQAKEAFKMLMGLK